MIERLESRVLFAAAVVKLIGGKLFVRADDLGDTIVVGPDAGHPSQLTVTITHNHLVDEKEPPVGGAGPFAASVVRRVRVVGGAGNDRVELNLFGGNARIRTRVRGGGGNDILVGGDGKDYLNGGAHNDTIDGRGGKDRIVAGDGNDYVDGGNDAVRDRILGGPGVDTIEVDAPDVIHAGPAPNQLIDQREPTKKAATDASAPADVLTESQ